MTPSLPDNSSMSVVGHLEELRKRILISLCAIFILLISIFPFTDYLINILRKPSSAVLGSLAFLSPTEAFTAYIKTAVFAALVAASPLIVYQIYCYCRPALTEAETRIIPAVILFSTLCFGTGLTFAYIILLPATFSFLMSFSRPWLQPVISLGEYISFVIWILAVSGLLFEMPVIAWIGARLGLITSPFMRSNRRSALIVILIISAILTPTQDAFTMAVVAVPVIGLYELCIIIVRFTER